MYKKVIKFSFKRQKIFWVLVFGFSTMQWIYQILCIFNAHITYFPAVPTRLDDSRLEKAISMRKWDLFYDLKSIWCQLSLRGLRLHKIWENMEMNMYIPCKVENILKGNLDWILSPLVKIQIIGGKVCLRCKGKTLQGIVNKLLKTKSLLTSPAMLYLITSSKLSHQ